jgi:pyruvate,orthophosphate dikinase
VSGGLAAIDAAVAAVADPRDVRAVSAAVLAVTPADVVDTIHGGGSGIEVSGGGEVVAKGLGASPGVARGRAYGDVRSALDAWERGEAVVYVAVETSPVDEPAMRVASAVVTSRGGLASHAAVISRDLGIPAVCGAGAMSIADGTELVVDGATGEVRRAAAGDGAAPARSGAIDDLPDALRTLLGWADGIVGGRLEIWSNADGGETAARARRFGARGVGLCRIEHMFLGARTELVRRGIAGDVDAGDELAAVVRDEVAAICDAAGGPVVVRLLDAPRHEFGGPAEHNPMLGVRGVRAGILDERLTRLQARAMAEVAAARAEGPTVEVMVPMVALPAELELVRGWVTEEFTARGAGPVRVGAMIETPRAALCADRLARHADFFSIGSNDLTQLTYGWSRDDVEATVLPVYRERGVLEVSPFETLDVGGVVRLMALAVETGRATSPGLVVSLCGEHGGDPASVAIAVQLGLDHVSCSAYRVPVARLAAAHAMLGVSGKAA